MGNWNSIVRADGALCFLVAVVLLILPLKWVIAVILAVFWHECGHAAAVVLTGGKITGLRFGVQGACMETQPMTKKKELVCSLAGPGASLFLILFCRVFPRLAVCGFVQGIYNLLPIYPLDGWRILHCVCCLASGSDGEQKICTIADMGTRLMICTIAGLTAVFLRIGLIPLLSVILFLCSRKIPCKDGVQRVQ